MEEPGGAQQFASAIGFGLCVAARPVLSLSTSSFSPLVRERTSRFPFAVLRSFALSLFLGVSRFTPLTKAHFTPTRVRHFEQ